MYLEGQRIILTDFTIEDIDSLLKLWNNGKVTKFVGFPTGLHKTREDIHTWYNKNFPATNLSEGSYYLKVTDKAMGFLGEAGLGKMTSEGISDLDIKLLPEHWGNGYGTEVLSLLIDYAFKETPIKVLELTPNIKNTGAIKLYTKLGFRKIGPIKYIETLGHERLNKIFQPMYYQTMHLNKGDQRS